jgi:hypothetical protein
MGSSSEPPRRQILSAFDRIGQKKKKRRFLLARVEETILQFFPGLWLA